LKDEGAREQIGVEPTQTQPWRNQDIENLSLRIYPDCVLREVCEPVERFDSELRDLLDEMLRLMRAKEGIGLAAPQVGITRRLFVCEIEGQSMSLVNPGIEGGVGSDNMVEGCLSLPDTQVDVRRKQEIRVAAYDARGRKKRLEATGLWARVIQHEIDHLNGILICDHGDPIETQSGNEAE